ncbi:methyltransferase domain-containing protein [Luteimonas sp. XNQY3]|nr:methyltransferase domain-containing protein [Luteimonas sp. XNQY3]MCD9004756.1 methyltransferase domain-containing protein [Luteimonas sp. XNQY3]
MRTASSHHLRFLRAWLDSPLRVGAIAPSGKRLASLMTRDIGPACGPVLELGPGTGAFTQALLERGVQERDLTLVERGEDFIGHLHSRFPASRILRMDATQAPVEGLFAHQAFGAVISGVPLLSLGARRTTALLSWVFPCLKDGGAFYQFTYGFGCPVPACVLARLDLVAERIGFTVRNLPPATVYRIARRSSGTCC